MNIRIKELRKSLKLTQQEFADRLGLKRNTVATYELGRIAPSDAVIVSICREFSVNESWLREGTGEMFLPQRKDDMIAKMLADVLVDDESFKYRLASALAKLDEDGWRRIEEFVDSIIEGN